MAIRILLADDHQVIREGLRVLLSREQDFEVVGEASNGEEAIRLAGELHPDLVILDVTMPGMNGIEAAKQLAQDHPQMKTLALSMHVERRYVAEMLKAGVSAYLDKACAFEEVVSAIRAVMGGQTYLSPSVTGGVVEDYVQRLDSKDAPSSILSEREREVLRLMAEGHSTKQIAFQLGISNPTVETYRRRIMQKLNLHSVADLTKYALRKGLTTLET